MPNGAAGLTAPWGELATRDASVGALLGSPAVSDVSDNEERIKWGCRKLLNACLLSAALQVLPNGEEIKLQRNALVVLQLPRGDEQVSWST